MDLTEKMAFFEAYGAIAGAAGAQAAERDCCCRAGCSGMKEASGDARLRRDGAREDPHARGSRACCSARPRTRISWCATP